MKKSAPYVLIVAIVWVFALFAGGCGGGGPEPAGTAVTTITPADGATGVPVTQVMTVQFSKDLDEATLTAANITLTRANGAVNVPGAIAYDAATKSLTFTPAFPMAANALHTFTMKAAATTKAAGDYATTFTTQTTPILFISSPDPNTSAVNIWSMNADGTGQTQLTAFANTATGSANGFVAWSPDYTRIAFLARAGSATNLYVMNADGSGVTNLTNGGANYEVRLIKWAPDGSRIFFLFTADASASSDVYDIGTVKPDGTGLANLTNMTGTLSVAFLPFSLTPDGARIVYGVDDTAHPEVIPRDIHIMQSDGSGDAKLTNATLESPAMYPILSADGSKIYYSMLSGATGGSLHAMSLDGSGQQVIVAPVADRSIIPWSCSPDGTQIAVSMITPPFTSSAAIVSADGSAVTELAAAAGANTAWMGSWSWSPDGSKVAYLYGDIANGPTNLSVAGRDGSGAVNITGFTGETRVFDYQTIFLLFGIGVGQWSPDGTQLHFTEFVQSTGFANVAAAKADGSGMTLLTNFAAPVIGAFTAWW